MRNKKGDLNITVNAIVVIVLALTFLSLGLVFIRQIFEGISDTTLTVQDQIRQQILDDLRRGDKKLSFPADEITVARGKEKIFGIGVKNVLDAKDDFTVEIFDSGGIGVPNSATLQDNSKVGFFWDSSPQTLGVNDVGVIGIKVIGPTEGQLASDIFKMVIRCTDDATCAGDNSYASKSFFVKVIG
ncbi:hypothetical protein HY638_04190 [Candidatus Woesearchaeota archaeon]|nr:hypothetical protein [Candidatus Woesearchaeota archaeon]